jgi:hypothetical protein
VPGIRVRTARLSGMAGKRGHDGDG